MPDAHPGKIRRQFAVGLVLLTVFLIGASYALANPLFEASDELWHYPMVKTLADGNGLPVQDASRPGPWRQEGSQPPLYYYLMAWATGWIDTSDLDEVRWLNPHADNGVITADRNNNIAIHTYRESEWPWRGTVLAVRLIRLLSVAMAVGTVYFTYRLALEIGGGRFGLALAAAACAGFTPMFLFISASVNNDNLVILTSTAALWLMARWVRTPATGSLASAVGMGAVLGAAALSKVSALGLAPLAAAALAFAFLQPVDWRSLTAGKVNRDDLSTRLRQAALALFAMTGTALAVAGWWYWRNWRLYGDWLGWEQFLGLVGRRAEPASLIQLWGERVGFVQAYWGLFGGVSVPMPDWIYTIFNAIVVAAALGLAWGLLRAVRRQSIGQVDLALWAILVAWLGLLIAGLARWTSLTQASQGRLLFPGIAAISLFIAAGLRQWWRRLPWVVVAWMGVVAASVPWAVIAPHYAPPPNLAPAEVAAIPSRLGAVFGNEMKLLGYHLQGDRLRPGEVVRVTLYWQSLIAMDRNWSVFVHVVDDSGLIVAQRDRYPGEGSLATTQLQPGQILADRFAIRLPPATYTPAQAHLSVGLYDHLDGTRLAVAGGGDALEFGRLELVPNAGAVPNPLGQNIDNQIELAGYDLTARSLRPGGTLDLTLFWRALAEVRQNYSVSARVRQADGTRWAVQDSWPQQGAAPTSSWRLGQLITDTYRLQLDAATPPGQYELEVVVYDPGSLKPLQLVSADGRRLDDNAIRLSGVLIRP